MKALLAGAAVAVVALLAGGAVLLFGGSDHLPRTLASGAPAATGSPQESPAPGDTVPASPSTAPAQTATATVAPTSAAVGAPPTTPATGAPVPAGNSCAAAGFTVTATAAGGGMGQRYGYLSLRSTATKHCTVSGYPQVQLLNASGAPVPTISTPAQVAAGPVDVAPGQTIWSTLAWTVVPAEDETAEPCEPPATQLAVTLPGDPAQVRVPFAPDAVCQHGRITVGPLSTQQPPQG